MNRRQLIKNSLGGLGALVATQAFGQTCKTELTAPQTKGPFYPLHRTVDQDADLVTADNQLAEALGQKILIRGLMVDQNCAPVAGALVDLWQACASGRYNHPNDPNTAELDPHFQYSAKILTNEKGEFNLRTIIPGAYPASADWMRPPHIHLRLTKLGYKELVTQIYFDLFSELNSKDLILNDLKPSECENVTIKMKRAGRSEHQVLGEVELWGEVVLAIRKMS